jgi:cytochrome c biogenesis protein CcdA
MRRYRRHMAWVERLMGAVLLITGLLIAGEALGWARDGLLGAVPALAPVSGWLGLALAAAGLFFALRQVHAQQLAGLAAIVVGMMLMGGSINVLGQWLIENVPVLAELEELATPKDLQTDILRRSGQ